MNVAGVLWLALLVLGSGCASLGAAQTANTMGKGQVQLSFEPAYAYWGISIPRADLGVRFGVTDSVDIGAKVGSSLFEINGKFQITDPGKDFVVSIAPSAGGFGLAIGSDAIGAFNFAIPVLLGINVGDGHQIVIGPRFQDLLLGATGTGSGSGFNNFVGVGSSVGFSIKASDLVRVMPEFSLIFLINPPKSGGSSGTDLLGSPVLGQFGITLLIGRVDQHVPGAAPLPIAPGEPPTAFPPIAPGPTAPPPTMPTAPPPQSPTAAPAPMTPPPLPPSMPPQ